jgi:hypothetical protein
MDIPEIVIAAIRRTASYGVTHGRDDTPEERAYYRRCTHFHAHSGSLIMFTRDAGHHSSGWMKNPDYERCLHVSLSFRIPMPNWPVDRLVGVEFAKNFFGYVELWQFNSTLADQWVQAILGHDAAKLSWHEGPFSQQGKEAGVQHWRVFCDRSWSPIHPRGEVYNKEFAEKGWKSYSDLNVQRPSHVNAD